MKRVFLSHNSADKAFSEGLAAAMQLLGAQVWFDAWRIRPGDSIPSAINSGLRDFDIFVLVWSSAAATSRWVEHETNGAFARHMTDSSTRLIPIVLDDATLPELLRHIRYVDAREARPAPIELARQVIGLETDRQVRIAVQRVIEASGLEFTEYYGVGTLVGCPKCGASLDKITGVHAVDDYNDRTYVGAQCTECDWSEASEL